MYFPTWTFFIFSIAGCKCSFINFCFVNCLISGVTSSSPKSCNPCKTTLGEEYKIILAPLLGFTLLGNYSLALQIFTILVIFSSIVFKFLLPQDSSGNSSKRIKKYTILVSIVISVFGVVVVPKIIPIFFIKFIETADAISIMSLAIVPETITMLLTSKMLGQEKSRFILIGKLMSLVIMIIGFIVLGPIYGIIGLAFVIVAASIIQVIFLVIMDRIVEDKINV